MASSSNESIDVSGSHRTQLANCASFEHLEKPCNGIPPEADRLRRVLGLHGTVTSVYIQGGCHERQKGGLFRCAAASMNVAAASKLTKNPHSRAKMPRFGLPGRNGKRHTAGGNELLCQLCRKSITHTFSLRKANE
jgi:hypothetical protein